MESKNLTPMINEYAEASWDYYHTGDEDAKATMNDLYVKGCAAIGTKEFETLSQRVFAQVESREMRKPV